MSSKNKIDTKLDDFNCPQGIDPRDRLELLQKIIDNEASLVEKNEFYESVENCEQCQCSDLCSQHAEIKDLLKQNVVLKPMPVGLVDVIKERIQKSID